MSPQDVEMGRLAQSVDTMTTEVQLLRRAIMGDGERGGLVSRVETVEVSCSELVDKAAKYQADKAAQKRTEVQSLTAVIVAIIAVLGPVLIGLAG